MLGGQVDGFLGGREVVVAAAAVAGSAPLLTARPRCGCRGRVAGGVGGRVVGQGIGGLTGLATASVEALLEEADFGFEVGDALLQSLTTALPIRSTLGELGLEFGLARGRALVKGLVVASLLTQVAEGLLAGRAEARQLKSRGMGEGSVHAQA